MFPEDVAHEGRRPSQKVLFAHGAHVTSAHAKMLQNDAFQREFLDGPVQPAADVQFRPEARICNNKIHQFESSKNFPMKNVLPKAIYRHKTKTGKNLDKMFTSRRSVEWHVTTRTQNTDNTLSGRATGGAALPSAGG